MTQYHCPIQPQTYHPTDNPMKTQGFAFVEFSSAKPELLAQDFLNLGFCKVAQHKKSDITLYQQGEIYFFINTTPGSHSHQFQTIHGACASAMGFLVEDPNFAFERAKQLGAKPAHPHSDGFISAMLAIYGIGDSLLYFTNRAQFKKLLADEFTFFDNASPSNHAYLTFIDHLTHNVYKGNMDEWAHFYEYLFNFHEIRYFDIQGKMTGLFSRALSSPCGNIKIPLNESKDAKSQIQEYLDVYKGEGIQHLALYSDDIYTSIEKLRQQHIQFLDVPDTYFEMLNERVPNHHEDLPRLQRNKILVDGNPDKGQGLLLQLFTQNMLGPIFFEIIQRKGNQGFGEGNFQALFDAIERDQVRRGVFKETSA